MDIMYIYDEICLSLSLYVCVCVCVWSVEMNDFNTRAV